MKKQNLSLGVLALTGALAALPAFAQTQNTNTITNETMRGRGNMHTNQTGTQEFKPSMMGGRGDMMRDGGIGMSGIGRPVVMGTVTGINGNSLTVLGENGPREASTTPKVTYTIDATNAKVIKNDATSTVSSIALNDKIAVHGTLNGTTVAATFIRDGMMGRGRDTIMNSSSSLAQFKGNGQPVVAGAITSINGNSVTITNKSNVSYTIDVTNAKITVKNAAGTPSSLTVGDHIFVQGTINGQTITASTVLDNGTEVPSQAAQANRGDVPGQGMMDSRGDHGGIFGGITSFFSRIFGF